MTRAEMMAEMMAARRESARAMELLAQAISGFAHGGHGGNGGNGGGARCLEGPSSYQDFLKTHPPTFTSTDEPLDVEHWHRILEQKFLLLNVADEQKVHFAVPQLLGVRKCMLGYLPCHAVARSSGNLAGVHSIQRVLYSCWCHQPEAD